jgi:hypothetical protein
MTASKKSSQITCTPKVINNYYEWLCDMIHVNTFERSYWLLAKTLHKREYYWTVPNDDNRNVDGQKLREEYLLVHKIPECLKGGYATPGFCGPCSMLEMLVGLAKRMADMMQDVNEEGQIYKWFWIILENCGLGKFTDEAFVDLGGPIAVLEVVDKVLERGYRRDGKGGLFPLKHTTKDQRKIEIWYQMCEYILENYNIFD